MAKKNKWKPTQRDILVKDERKQFLMACETLEEILFSRLALYSGLRLSELISLTFNDLIPGELVLHIRDSKGGKSRWVSIDLATAQLIRGYMVACNCPERGEDIFTMSGRTYQRMVQDIAERAKIDRIKVTPHVLRHTNITMLLDAGMPIEKVMLHAGHEDIRTTMLYTH
jgi:integrase/recombinase XerD